MRRNPFSRYLGPEDILHSEIIRYISLQYPRAVVVHAPNEGKRSPFERYKAKVLGVRAGVSDLLIFYKGKVLALELKSGKNKPTEYQLQFISDMRENGFEATWTNDFDIAKVIIDNAFGGLK